MRIRYMTAGESHGSMLTVIVEGIPAGIPIDEAMIEADLSRRQLATGAGGRMSIERDHATILSGVLAGHTTGAPIALQIPNRDHASWIGREVNAYTTPRPGHADLAAVVKYGYDDIRHALERSSARETASRVAMGALCRTFLKTFGIEVGSYVASIGGSFAPTRSGSLEALLDYAKQSICVAPNAEAEKCYLEVIDAAKNAGDTLGGIIECITTGLPIGLGSFVSADRRLDARLGAALLSVQAIKGIEFGPAFRNTTLPGTEVHDPIYLDGRKTNRCGGLEGGMTNGEPLVVRVAMKPIPTTIKTQLSVDLATNESAETTYERSDTCPVPRACVVIESMVAYILADALIEKLGGDSLSEMQQRYATLPEVKDITLSPAKKVFWPNV